MNYDDIIEKLKKLNRYDDYSYKPYSESQTNPYYDDRKAEEFEITKRYVEDLLRRYQPPERILSDQEKLDSIELKVIEKYLREKKLSKIKKLS